MKILTLAAVTLTALIGVVGHTTAQSPSESAAKTEVLTRKDEAAVREIVAEFNKAWNSHDMKAMHALNTDDVEWINVTANHWRGNAVVLKGHSTIHRTIVAKTDMSVEKILVRSIAPGVALAVATMKFGPTATPTGEVLPARTRGTFTMVKQGAAWKIAHFQNTIIDPIAEKHDPITWDETGWLPGRK